MLPLPFTLATARRRAHAHIEQATAQLPLQVRHRIVTDRITKEKRHETYAVQPKAVPTTCKDLLSFLCKLALRAVEETNRQPTFEFTPAPAVAPGEAVPLAQVPTISVNCKSLARLRGMSDRTIRTHINLLRELGAIVAKHWHGTRSNFELVLNPDFLWRTPENDVKNGVDSVFESTRLSSILTSQGTEFPVSVAFETLETSERAIEREEKLLAQRTPDGAAPQLATLAGNPGPQAAPKPAPDSPERASGGAAGAEPSPAPAPALSRTQLYLVRSLWAYARPLLYAGQHFDAEQEWKAHTAILNGVFGAFGPDLTEAQWELYHAQALLRVDLVTEWLARNPGRFIPAPYAELVAGRGYFDRQNAQGFVATEAWLAKKLANQHEYRKREALRKAQAELRGWRKRTAAKRVLALTYNQLIHKHKIKIKPFGPQAERLLLAIIAGTAPTQ